MFNVIKNYNGIECSYHKIGVISVNNQNITVHIWSYINSLSEENGENYINETIFNFNPTDIDKENLISDICSKITL